MVELTTIDWGNDTAIFPKNEGGEAGDTGVTYNNQEITIFLYESGIYGDKVKVCFDILDKYLEINEIAKKAVIENMNTDEDLKNYFEYIFSSMNWNLYGVPNEEYFIKNFIENWAYPHLLFWISHDKITISVEYVLTEEWGQFVDSLIIDMDEKLNITGFDHRDLRYSEEEEDGMTITELSEKLSEMYENAPDDDKVAMLHLFGIRYSGEIKKSGYILKEIIENTKLKNGLSMNQSYDAEISKGLKLAKYVTIKESINNYIEELGE
jgi:5-methylcytosine-specific restriction protein B